MNLECLAPSEALKNKGFPGKGNSFGKFKIRPPKFKLILNNIFTINDHATNSLQSHY